jgi:hypothetical protein
MKLPKQFSGLTNLFHYGDRVHPARDWFFIVTVLSGLIVASAIWNSFLFLRVVNGQYIGVTATTTPSVVNSSLDDVHKVFDARAAEENRYRSEYRFVDPSLPGS